MQSIRRLLFKLQMGRNPPLMRTDGQAERRIFSANLFEVQPDGERWKIVRRSDGKSFGYISSLKRASDIRLNHERAIQGEPVVKADWQVKIDRMNAMCESRKTCDA